MNRSAGRASRALGGGAGQFQTRIVPPRIKRALLLGGSCLALSVALGAGRPALALDECGAPAGSPPTITCTPAGNDFPGGIQYKVTDLTIVVQDGVVIDTTGASGEPGGIVSGGNGTYGTLVIKAGTAAGSGVSVSVDDDQADGIYARSTNGTVTISSYTDLTIGGDVALGIAAISTAGSVTITSTGDISTSGSGIGTIAILASSTSGAASVTSTGDISTSGKYAAGIRARSWYGPVTVTSTGDMTIGGEYGVGILADGIKAGASVTVISTGDITTTGKFNQSIYARSVFDSVNITSTGDLATDGDSSDAVLAFADSDDVTIVSTGAISTAGHQANGIRATSNAGGKVSVTSTGDIATGGDDARGVYAYSKTGNVEVRSTGDITTKGAGDASGIYAQSGTGDVTVTSIGNVTTYGGDYAFGISAYSSNGTVKLISVGDIKAGDVGLRALSIVTSVGDVEVHSTGDITTNGGNFSSGIVAAAFKGDVTVTSIGDIATSGDGASGISAGTGHSGVLKVTSTGNITTSGLGANGITADSGAGAVTLVSTGNITASLGTGIRASSGDGVMITSTGDINSAASAIDASSQTSVKIISVGDITVTGDAVVGVSAWGDSSAVVSLTGDLRTAGEHSGGIAAFAQYGAATVTVQGDVVGGWGLGFGVRVLGASASTLTISSGSSVGALNDRAVLDEDEALIITNNGTITGYISLANGHDVLNNISTTTFDLRHFEDMDGDGVRDREFVAVADFGAGTDDFNNIGTLRLAPVSGATSWDTTGQIAHPGGGASDIAQAGIEQGFLTGLETFKNAGLITLRDGTPGDLLVITDQADGNTKGGNVFTSNGGGLALDVVMDDGSSKQSDVLILDKAVTGTGATRVHLSNVGGGGAQTTGDGILVVNVRDASDATAFATGSGAVAGAYQYDLYFQNQAKTDQNWYLRSRFFDGAMEYPAISSAALESFQTGLGGIGDQMRQRRAQVAARDALAGQLAELPNTATDIADSSSVRVNDSSGNAGWFRVSGSDLDIDQDRGADFDLSTVRAEAGFDVGFGGLAEEDDWLVTGVFAGYGWSSAGFDSGSAIDFDIASVGAYATYFRGPYYLDAVVKFDWMDGDYNSDNVSDDGDVELPVFGLSLETGYRFDLTPNGFYLQPQVQLTYAHAGDDSITDDSGVNIELEDADSLRGRLGARIGQELGTTAGAAAEPVRGNFYLEASVNQEFLGETDARVSGLTLEQELPETTFEVGGGFDIALPKQGVTFTVDADYILGDDADGVSATGGFRINW